MNDLPGGVAIVNTAGIRNNGTFRWDDAKDIILLKEIRVVEPYIGKIGSKEAGQGWTDVAKLVNTYNGFKEMPRDQRSVRERFNKILGEFQAKMRSEEKASGISPKPPTEVEILLEEISEIMLNTVHPEKHKDQKEERVKALAVRNAAMNTWSKTIEATGTSGDEADIDGSIEGDSKNKSKRGRKRRSSGDPLEYLRIKTHESMIIQQQEIELRKEQAILEKQKLEAKEKQQQQKQEELILQQQKMNQLLESQQKQFNMQPQQMQMQMQMQMQTQAAMIAVLEKLAK